MDKFEALLAKSKANTPATTVAEPINTFDAVLAKRTSLPAVEPRALSLGDRLLASVSQVAPVQAVLRSDPRQTALDIGGGLTRAGAGLYDLGKLGIETIGYPVSQPIEYLKGIPAEERSFQKALTFPTYSAVEEGLKEIAEPRGLDPKSLSSRLVEYGTAGVPGLIGGLTMEGGAKIGEVVGGETGKAIGGAIGTIAGVFAPGASKNAMKKGAKLFESLDTRAQKQVLDRMSPDEIEKLRLAQEANTITSTVNVPKTLAEVTESPSIAAQQAALESTTTPITSTIAQRKEALREVAETIGQGTTKGEFEYLVNEAVNKGVAKKQAAEGALLEKIEGIDVGTPRAAGEEIQQSLVARKAAAKAEVDKKWAQVPKTYEIDLTDEIDPIFDWWNSQDALRKRRASRVGRSIRELKETALDPEYPEYIMTYDRFQAIREGLNDTIANTRKGNERRLARQLKDKMDIALGSVDPKELGQDLNTKDIRALYDAIGATREFSQKYREGVVGTLTRERLGNLQTKASSILRLIKRNPENVSELVSKFGKKTDEILVFRQELLKELNAQKDVNKYLNKNIDVYKAAFGDDLNAVTKYAKLKQEKLPIEQWMTNATSEAALPSKIFQNRKSITTFMNDFAGTEIVDIAKSKFINRMMARGDINTRTAYYNEIGKELFGKDWEFTQQLLKDLESIKAPNQLLKTKAAGGSATETRQAVRRTLDQSIAEQNLADRAPTLGAWIGATFGSITGSPRATIAAGATGKWLGETTKTGLTKRAERMRTAMAQLFADPRLIDLAKKPATEENIKALDNTLRNLAIGRGVAISMREEEGE